MYLQRCIKQFLTKRDTYQNHDQAIGATYPQTHDAYLSVANDPLPGLSLTNGMPTQVARPVVAGDLPHEIFRVDKDDLNEFIQKNKGITNDLATPYQCLFMVYGYSKCKKGFTNEEEVTAHIQAHLNKIKYRCAWYVIYLILLSDSSDGFRVVVRCSDVMSMPRTTRSNSRPDFLLPVVSPMPRVHTSH